MTINASFAVQQYELPEPNEQTGWGDKVKSATIFTQELDEGKHNDTNGSIHWQTGVLARFPWLGFGALLTILVSMAMTIVIMKTSNGKNPNEWPGMTSSGFSFI